MTDQIPEKILDELTGPSVWAGPEIQNDPNWIYRISDEGIADIDAALHQAEKAGVKIPFSRDHFPLTVFTDELRSILDDVREGRGFAIVRGIPRERYTDEQCALIYWGIGTHIGRPVSQNARGHLLGHVMDEGRSYDDPTARGYQTHQRMDFHCDLLPVDVLGLFCLRQAKSGGMSHLVSSLMIHNVLRRERPDLLEEAYELFTVDWRGEEPEGEKPWYRLPMLSVKDGKVTSRFMSRQYYESCERFGPEYALTQKQKELLDLVQEIANRPELRVTMRLQEGDIQLVNNHTTMHARDEFEDYDEPELKRHLLRMWIALPDEIRRPLSPLLDERYGWVQRGGIPVKQVQAA